MNATIDAIADCSLPLRRARLGSQQNEILRNCAKETKEFPLGRLHGKCKRWWRKSNYSILVHLYLASKCCFVYRICQNSDVNSITFRSIFQERQTWIEFGISGFMVNILLSACIRPSHIQWIESDRRNVEFNVRTYSRTIQSDLCEFTFPHHFHAHEKLIQAENAQKKQEAFLSDSGVSKSKILNDAIIDRRSPFTAIRSCLSFVVFFFCLRLQIYNEITSVSTVYFLNEKQKEKNGKNETPLNLGVHDRRRRAVAANLKHNRNKIRLQIIIIINRIVAIYEQNWHTKTQSESHRRTGSFQQWHIVGEKRQIHQPPVQFQFTTFCAASFGNKWLKCGRWLVCTVWTVPNALYTLHST